MQKDLGGAFSRKSSSKVFLRFLIMSLGSNPFQRVCRVCDGVLALLVL